MSDTVRAQRLVADDADHLGALAAPSDIQLAQLDRDIHPAPRRDSGDDTHAHRHGAASYARLDARPRRSSSFGSRAGDGAASVRFDGGHGGEKDAVVDRRRLQVLWWRSAAVNVLFILAWCVRAARSLRAPRNRD